MSYFAYVGKLISNVKGFYNEINAATLTGAIDVIIIQKEDGTYISSPFHVRFGKLGVLRTKEKVVDIEINGKPVDFHMKLGDSGEAFFVQELEEENEEIPSYLATSPIPSDTEIQKTMENGIKELRKQAAFSVTENEQSHKIATGSRSVHRDSETSETTIKSGSTDNETKIRTESETREVPTKSRRRRKKKNSKKKASSRSKTDLSQNPSESESIDRITEEGDIFEMEDVGDSTDDEMFRLTSGMGKSISLPVMEANRLERTSEWASAHEGFKYLHNHPFSDTDLSPLGSPETSRPGTPKSDTEVDRKKSEEYGRGLHLPGEDSTLWEWGNLPRKSVTEESVVVRVEEDKTDPFSPAVEHDEKASSGGLFHFMRKTKNVRHQPEAEGIYLDDLNLQEMDPEILKLYFPKGFSGSGGSSTHFQSIREKDEDNESGRGASLPQSPHSVEGAIGGPSVSFLKSEVSSLGLFSLSLCGGLQDPDGVNLEKFMQKIVTYDDLCNNSAMVNNPDLVVRVHDKYYNWPTAAPMILSYIVFQKELPEKTQQSLITTHMPKKKEKKAGGVTSWFSWGRAPTAKETGAQSTTTTTIVQSTSDSEVLQSKADGSAALSPPNSEPPSAPGSPRKLLPKDRLKLEDQSSSDADTDGSERGRTKRPVSEIKINIEAPREKFKKSLRLTSEQISQLNLNEGQNDITYSVTSQFQGTSSCTCHVYLWKHNDKIVVSDIDGTITKSDVLGQILPIMGRDWSQSGVAELFTRIYGNGYKFLYLSARAIGQSKLTKDMLRNIKQGEKGERLLPDGPLLLSPTSLISAFHREVIEKKPEEFKINCLKDIASLFPSNHNPFYAGFGNKINDVYAYKAINIPIFRIFTINPRGELKHEQSYTFQSSYEKLMDIADHFFPPIHKTPGMKTNEFNQVQFWMDPLPDVSDLEIQDMKEKGIAIDR